jgi:hypothetical protein
MCTGFYNGDQQKDLVILAVQLRFRLTAQKFGISGQISSSQSKSAPLGQLFPYCKYSCLYRTIRVIAVRYSQITLSEI